MLVLVVILSRVCGLHGGQKYYDGLGLGGLWGSWWSEVKVAGFLLTQSCVSQWGFFCWPGCGWLASWWLKTWWLGILLARCRVCWISVGQGGFSVIPGGQKKYGMLDLWWAYS